MANTNLLKYYKFLNYAKFLKYFVRPQSSFRTQYRVGGSSPEMTCILKPQNCSQ